MTISDIKMNDRLTRIERCAEMAPSGTYERARDGFQVPQSVVIQGLKTMRTKCVQNTLRGIVDRIGGMMPAPFLKQCGSRLKT